MAFKDWGWARRLALVLSLAWLILIYATTESDRSVFWVVGVLPLALVWGIGWVIAGLASKRSRKVTVGAVTTTPAGASMGSSKKLDVIFFLIGLGGIGLVYALVLNVSGPMRASSAAGQLTGSFVVIAGVAYLFASGRSAPTRATTYLLAVAAVSYFLIDILQQERARTNEEVTVQESLARLAAISQDALDKKKAELAPSAEQARSIDARYIQPPSPPPISPAPAQELRGAALVDAVAPILQAANQSGIEGSRRYNESLEALRLNEVLTPERLADASSAHESRERLSAFVRLLRTAEAQNDKALTDYRTQLKGVNMAPEERTAFEASYATSQAKMQDLYRAFYSTESELASTMIDVVSFMETVSSGRRARVESGKLVFQDDSELMRYNAYIDALHNLANRESDLQQQMVDFQQRSVDKMRGLAGNKAR